jgi:aminoglycoside 3-N-acetyltransferase
MQFADYLKKLGLTPNSHILAHSSFRSIINAFSGITINQVIKDIQNIITETGSLVMPAFTYCFRKSIGDYEFFDRAKTECKVGTVSEVFRKSDGVIRTSSPTHSFSLWGRVAHEIGSENNPKSPLGKDSVLDWLTQQSDAYILLLGVDFSAMSFCHYLEVAAQVPWYDFSPWVHLHVENIGVSIDDEFELNQIPGCSKSFKNFEKDLVLHKLIKPTYFNSLSSYLIPVSTLLQEGLQYFRKYPEKLLCPEKSCKACDSRWEFYLKALKRVSQVKVI